MHFIAFDAYVVFVVLSVRFSIIIIIQIDKVIKSLLGVHHTKQETIRLVYHIDIIDVCDVYKNFLINGFVIFVKV